MSQGIQYQFKSEFTSRLEIFNAVDGITLCSVDTDGKASVRGSASASASVRGAAIASASVRGAASVRSAASASSLWASAVTTALLS